MNLGGTWLLEFFPKDPWRKMVEEMFVGLENHFIKFFYRSLLNY